MRLIALLSLLLPAIAGAQDLTQDVSTGQPADWSLLGSNDADCLNVTDWTAAQTGTDYRCFRIELTNVPPAPFCGDAVCNGSESCLSCAQDCGACQANCTTFNASSSNSAAGDNTITVGGVARSFRLIRIGSGPSPALIFVYHYRTTSFAAAEYTINDLGLLGGNTGNFLIVAPRSNNGQGSWRINDTPSGNADLALFDDLITCLDAQYDVNLDRVSAAGYSAGAMFVSYLVMHRAGALSAVSTHSGGLQYAANWGTPAVDVPSMIGWGGTSDTYYEFGLVVDPLYQSAQYTHSFHLANLDFASRLEADGHFVVRCNYGGGHSTVGPVSYDPSRGGYVWPQNWPFRWLYDHVRGQPSPFQSGFPPGTMPSSCQ